MPAPIPSVELPLQSTAFLYALPAKQPICMQAKLPHNVENVVWGLKGASGSASRSFIKWYDGDKAYHLKSTAKETRPDNTYVHFIIKTVTFLDTHGNDPVKIPLAAITPYASSRKDPESDSWDICDGRAITR